VHFASGVLAVSAALQPARLFSLRRAHAARAQRRQLPAAAKRRLTRNPREVSRRARRNALPGDCLAAAAAVRTRQAAMRAALAVNTRAD
jgi:hypothetical protein